MLNYSLVSRVTVDSWYQATNPSQTNSVRPPSLMVKPLSSNQQFGVRFLGSAQRLIGLDHIERW